MFPFLSAPSRPKSPFRLSTIALALTVGGALSLSACSSDDDDQGVTDPDVANPTDPADRTPPVVDDAVEVSLDSGQEVPPVTTPAPDAAGEGSISVDAAGAVSGEIELSGLTGPAQMAHIHRGFAGSAGPVLIGLDNSGDGIWSVPPGSVLDAAGLEAYRRGELYFNVHTDANPAGEVRGQIVPEGVTMFTVRLENVSDDGTLTVDGSDPVRTEAVPLSPGAFIVHREDSDDPLLLPRDSANAGLEAVAEDGNPGPYVMGDTAIAGATVFNTPVDADAPGPIGPGGAYELSFGAVPGDKLGFVTMFIASNDWFYTPTDEDNSIDLFDAEGNPTTGDVSDQVAIWDSGTEVDEIPGGDASVSPNQVRNQSAPNTGPDENVGVGSLSGMGKSVSLNGPVLQVTISAGDDR